MNFVAFDFETSNPDLSSICQVGLAVFRDGECVDTWSTLVNPLDYFHWRNVKVHGIVEANVKEAPTFSAIADDLFARLETGIVASHSRFDVASLSAACGKMNRLAPALRWVDSCQVARLVWQQFREDGYGLSRLAQRLGIQFSHHDAVEDARAAGLVLCRALRDSGKSVEEFVEQTSIVPMSAPRARRYRPSNKDSAQQNGNAEGKLLGEVVVFTGTLSIPRKEAALRVAQAGCAIDNTVTKRTTTLVVGDQDIRLLAGKKQVQSRLAPRRSSNPGNAFASCRRQISKH